MLLALPEHHPLARQATWGPADLANQEWIGVQHRQNCASRDDFISACIRAGFTPDIRMEATEPFTALGLVASGLGIAMIQKGLSRNAPPGVVLREVPWISLPRRCGRPGIGLMVTVGGDVQEGVDRAGGCLQRLLALKRLAHGFR